MNLFETSLPIRLDYEAMLAYLLLPPAGGVLLLIAEHKSDYVRYVSTGKRVTHKHFLSRREETSFQLTCLLQSCRLVLS